MLRHAMVSDKPGGLSVQQPPPPGKLAAQMNRLLAILVVKVQTLGPGGLKNVE